MPIKLQLEIIAFSIFMLVFVVRLVHKNHLVIKYSIVWMFAIVSLLLSTLIPGFLPWIAGMLGFETVPNLIFTMMIGIMIIVSMILTIIVSGLKQDVRKLTQEMALLKNNNKK